MNLLKRRDRFLESVKTKFPKARMIIGYGSGMKPQKDYKFGDPDSKLNLDNQSKMYKGKFERKSKISNPMMDLMLVVEDTSKFHLLNQRMNYDHYACKLGWVIGCISFEAWVVI